MDNLKDIKGGYEVPNAYFSDLKANVMAKAGQNTQTSWATTAKSIFGFVAGFAAMVLFAVGIIKLTPQDKINSDPELDQFILYSALYEDEIIDLIYIDSDENGEQFNDAVDEYVDLYGGYEANIDE